jgi:hypothetical protein
MTEYESSIHMDEYRQSSKKRNAMKGIGCSFSERKI